MMQVLMVRGQYVDIGKDHHPSAPLLLVGRRCRPSLGYGRQTSGNWKEQS